MTDGDGTPASALADELVAKFVFEPDGKGDFHCETGEHYLADKVARHMGTDADLVESVANIFFNRVMERFMEPHSELHAKCLKLVEEMKEKEDADN